MSFRIDKLQDSFKIRAIELSFTANSIIMPNLANAKKALRQADKRAERNKTVKAEIHSLRVKLRKAITAKNAIEALEVARGLGKKFDKAVGKKVFKQNTVARYKSRMMQKVNSLKKA